MFQAFFDMMHKNTYVVCVFATSSVRGQRTHTNAGTPIKFFFQANISLLHNKKKRVYYC